MVDFEELKKKILDLPGVHGVSIEDGKIIVFSDINYNNVDGVPITCLKAGGKPKTLELKESYELIEARREYWRPIPGGVSGADQYNTAGTIGMKVRYKGEYVMLSNSHIFTSIGLGVVQPSPADGGDIRKDMIGEVLETTPIDFNGGENTVDAALASSTQVLSDNILDLGVVNDYQRGNNEIHMLQRISKSGRDGVTTGRVIARNGMFKISYADQGDAIFSGVFVTTAMARPGSSGSIGVSNRKAVGLLFAGSQEVSLYIPMYKVVDRLGIEIG